MPVQWLRSRPKPIGPQILSCPPDRTIVIFQSPADYAVVGTHWDLEANSSVPCTGNGCQWCVGQAARVQAYAAAAVYAPRLGKWIPCVFALGDANMGLGATDHKGIAIRVGKEKEKGKRGRTIYYGVDRNESLLPLPKLQAFDPRPILLRRWGLFEEADLIDCEYHEAQPTLEFPQKEVI